MAWWEYVLNIDTLAVLVIIIAVLYFLFTTKRRKKRIDLRSWRGIPESVQKSLSRKRSEFDSKRESGTGFWDQSSRPKKSRKLYKHEERCRKIFQEIFGRKFPSEKPDWLKNPIRKGKNLELDGVCYDIPTPLGRGLAFEYDGVQHSRYTKRFHRSKSEFKYQVKKDEWKNRRCKEERVLLIRIPHWVAYEDLERYIVQELHRNQILPSSYSGRYREMATTAGDHSPSRSSYSSEPGSFLQGLYR
jgi:hypothetical protein